MRMLGGAAPPPSSSPALVGRNGGHSGFPQGTVHSFTLAAPTPICLTAHFIYDPKMNRPTEVPFPAHVAELVSGVAESCSLGHAGGDLGACVYGVCVQPPPLPRIPPAGPPGVF